MARTKKLFFICLVLIFSHAFSDDENDSIMEVTEAEKMSQVRVVENTTLNSKVSLLPPKDEYVYKQSIDFDLSRDNILNFGPFQIKSSQFRVNARKINNDVFLYFRWPFPLIFTGELKLYNSSNNQVLYKETIEAEDKKNIVKNYLKFELSGREEDILFENPSKVYFCISSQSDGGYLKACSGDHKVYRSRSGKVGIKRLKVNHEQAIIVNDSRITNKGEAIFKTNKEKLKLKAEFKSGVWIEIYSSPRDLEVIDLTYDQKSEEVTISASGVKLHGSNARKTALKRVNTSHGFFNFMPTIGAEKEYWTIKLKRTAPYFYIRGLGGVPFRFTVIPDLIPDASIRLKFDEDTLVSTYKSEMKVTGSKLKTIKVSGESKQKEATRFNLNLILEDRGKWNTVNFKLLDSENETTWPSNIGVYRGIARDLSLRMIGVLDSSENSMLMLGEISFQQWFESVFGWENPYLAHQRWGIGLKYFQTLSKPESSDKISSAVFDLKFRLNKGIWGWDPTFGLIFSFQNFSSIGNDGDITYSMLGIGGFWARSMPKFVDDIFNIIPFLRYPKWVDVEFIYYPIGLDNAYELGPNMNLNFHGKIQWTSFFHGEAGFGMKQYFADKIGETEYKLGTFYATLGFGLSF